MVVRVGPRPCHSNSTLRLYARATSRRYLDVAGSVNLSLKSRVATRFDVRMVESDGMDPSQHRFGCSVGHDDAAERRTSDAGLSQHKIVDVTRGAQRISQHVAFPSGGGRRLYSAQECESDYAEKGNDQYCIT